MLSGVLGHKMFWLTLWSLLLRHHACRSTHGDLFRKLPLLIIFYFAKKEITYDNKINKNILKTFQSLQNSALTNDSNMTKMQIYRMSVSLMLDKKSSVHHQNPLVRLG